MNEDYRDFLAALVAEEVRFLVVGAHALAVHGYPRATVDIDIWVESNPENAERVWRALAAFGAPVEGVTVPVLGVEDLVTNKLASGRDKDRADVRGLEGRS